jgi:hypothetical protein
VSGPVWCWPDRTFFAKSGDIFVSWGHVADMSVTNPAKGWLLHLSIKWRSHLRSRVRSSLYFDFSVAQFDGPNDRTMFHPTHITQRTVAPAYKPSLSQTFGWLLCPSIKWWPSKAKGQPIYLFFDVASFDAPKTEHGQQ